MFFLLSRKQQKKECVKMTTDKTSMLAFMNTRLLANLEYHITDTPFGDIETLYQFMTQYENMYIGGSFALTLCSPQRTYNSYHDIDIYIKIDTLVTLFQQYSVTVTETSRYPMMTMPATKTKLQFTVYNFLLQSTTKTYIIDIICVCDDIDTVVKSFDFTFLHNYIYPIRHTSDNETCIPTVPFGCVSHSPIDIFDRVLQFSPACIEHLHTLSPNQYQSVQTKVIIRCEKYLGRGYRIGNVSELLRQSVTHIPTPPLLRILDTLYKKNQTYFIHI
jgi:hypothetical protein